MKWHVRLTSLYLDHLGSSGLDNTLSTSILKILGSIPAGLGFFLVYLFPVKLFILQYNIHSND